MYFLSTPVLKFAYRCFNKTFGGFDIDTIGWHSDFLAVNASDVFLALMCLDNHYCLFGYMDISNAEHPLSESVFLI